MRSAVGRGRVAMGRVIDELGSGGPSVPVASSGLSGGIGVKGASDPSGEGRPSSLSSPGSGLGSGPASGPVRIPDPVRRRRAIACAAALVFLLVSILIGVSVGALSLSPAGVVSTLANQAGLSVEPGLPQLQGEVLVELRLPRVLLAAVVGALLSVSGAAYQGVFRNPLADPYLLGAAAGAGLGATLAIIFLPRNGITVPAAAFVGALAGVGMAYAVGSAAGAGTVSSGTLLLAGVAVASFLSAVQTLLLQSHSDTLREVYSWIFGQLGVAQWPQLRMILPYAVVSVTALLVLARGLDVLSVGDDEAASLGVRPARVRLVVLFAASLATAAAVAVAGLIAFVGLVVPHIVRRLAGGSYRTIMPVSLLLGGGFLVLADTLARTVLAPAELPIGVLTAFVGAPFFAVLLRGKAPVAP